MPQFHIKNILCIKFITKSLFNKPLTHCSDIISHIIVTVSLYTAYYKLCYSFYSSGFFSRRFAYYRCFPFQQAVIITGICSNGSKREVQKVIKLLENECRIAEKAEIRSKKSPKRVVPIFLYFLSHIGDIQIEKIPIMLRFCLC